MKCIPILMKRVCVVVMIATSAFSCSTKSDLQRNLAATSAPKIDNDLIRIANALSKRQNADGSWDGTLVSNPISSVLLYYLSNEQGAANSDSIQNYEGQIFDFQDQTTGLWPEFKGGPADVSVTGVVLYALKSMGVAKTDDRVSRAWNWFEKNGGFNSIQFFYRVALMGDEDVQIKFPFSGLLSPEFLSKKELVSIDNIGVLRSVIVPVIVWRFYRAMNEKHQKALPLDPEKRVAAGLDFNKSSKISDELLMQEAVGWILDRLQVDGTGIGVSLSSYVYGLALLEAQRAGVGDFSSEIRLTLSGAESFRFVHPSGKTLQSVASCSVWDTARSLKALNQIPESVWSLPADKKDLGLHWLLAHKSKIAQDWIQKGEPDSPSAWGFSANSSRIADFDDTELVVQTLIELLPKASDSDRKEMIGDIQSAVDWLLANQNKDGGFAIYDRNISSFLKLAAKLRVSWLRPWLMDESGIDVTARLLKLLTALKTLPEFEHDSRIVKSQDKVCSYINRNKHHVKGVPEKLWNSVWFVNYIPGTAATSIAMLEAGCMSLEDATEGVAWLERVQNIDGGWGESASDDETNRFVAADSTLAQTAWVLEFLSYYEMRRAKEAPTLPSVRASIDKSAAFIVERTQGNDIAFEEAFTGVFVPGIWHANWPVETHMSVVAALNRYRLLQNQ